MMVKTQHNQKQVNEKRLFHGTSPGNVEAICKNNFDPRLHKRTVLGNGTYFAVNASYSHSYATRDANLFQFMFLAKVLVGSYTKGRRSYRRPPPKQPSISESDLYDSCVDNNLYPTTFVVFDDNRFYPEYIIKYSSVDQPPLPTGLPLTKPLPLRLRPLPLNPPPPLPPGLSSPPPLPIRPERPSNLHPVTSCHPLTVSNLPGYESTPNGNTAQGKSLNRK